MSVRVLPLVLLLAGPAAAQDHTVRGTVVAADGSPVAGVEVSHFWQVFRGNPLKPADPAVSAADGTFAAKLPGWKVPAALLGLSADRTRAALAIVTDPKQAVTLTLGPAVAVTGHFTCTELNRRPAWTNVYVEAGPKNRPVFGFASDAAEFNIPLPAGTYRFDGYGTDVLGTKRPLEVPGDRSAFDLGAVDLKAAAIAKMAGKPPLPWHVKDARGLPKTVQAADLKGKWVLLDFWGHWCGPCVRELAGCIDFYELHANHRDQFEIIALHDSSVPDFAAMDQKLFTIKRGVWAGRDLPFPILLDDERKTERAYTIQGWPTSVLIDPAGNVVGGGNAGDKEAIELLEEKLPKLPPGAKAGRALDKVGAFGFTADSVDGMAKFLGRQGGVPVRLDAAALKAKGIDPAATVEFKLTIQATMRSFADLFLGPFGLVVKVDGDGLLITAGDPPAESKMQADAARRLRGVLARPQAVTLPATTLDGVCQYFDDKADVPLVLDPAARRAGKLDPNRPVPAFAAVGQSLAQSLRAILDPLGLEAVVRCEVVVVRPKG